MAKPTKDITWAKGSSPNTVEPSNERGNGYPNGFKVPAAAHNWQFEAIGDWIDWLQTGAKAATLEAGVAATAAGDPFVVAPLGEAYTQLEYSVGSQASEISSIAVDGERFYLAFATGPGFIRGYALSSTGDFTTGQELWSATGLGGVENYTRIVSNGTYVGAIYDTEWRIYNALTGASVYTGDHGAVLNDCVITDDYFCFVGVADGGNVAGGAVTLGDGTVTDMTSWGVSADLYGVAAVKSDTFIVVGESDGSGNYLGRASTNGTIFGIDQRSTGGLSAAPVLGARAASNGRLVFVHNNNGYLSAHGPWNLLKIWENTATAVLPSLVCDAKDLFFINDDDQALEIIDPQTGAVMRTIGFPGGGTPTLRPALAVNSNQILRGSLSAGGFDELVTYASGIRVRSWIREAAAPHFNQATPEVL